MAEPFYYDNSEEDDYQQMLMENSLSSRHFLQRMKEDVHGEDMVFCICFALISSFLKTKRGIPNNCVTLICFLMHSLDSSISRVITFNIPLVPANTSLRTLLFEIKENQYILIVRLIAKCPILPYPQAQICGANYFPSRF